MIPITQPFLGLEEAEAARDVVLSGWLSQGQQVAAFEADFAALVGASHACAVSNCTTALHLALLAVGAGPGGEVITVSHSFIAGPNAIRQTGALPVFVDVEPDGYNMDPSLLESAITARTQAILCVHQIGTPCALPAILSIAAKYGIPVIEDAAHSLGTTWAGRPIGTLGRVGCFSFQSYKMLNAGEGGMLVSDDADLIARATWMSGSYMLHDRHPAGPGPDAYAGTMWQDPNLSARMDHLRAAILRPQLRALPAACRDWTARYRAVEAGLAGAPGLALIPRPAEEDFVGSSFQFRLPDWSAFAIAGFVAACAARGVELKWFGAPEPVAFTSRYDSWRYAEVPHLPQTDAVLAGLLDLRLPLTFNLEDCALIARIIRAEVLAVGQGGVAPLEAAPQMGD